MDHCPHIHKPTEEAWARLRNPLQWACDSCRSTDGIWCCLRCGHIGCGRRAHLPALGGGHSKHHFHTTQGNIHFPVHSTDDEEEEEGTACVANSSDGKKKRVKILRILRSTSSKTTPYMDNVTESAASGDVKSNDNNNNSTSTGGHEVCIDIVSKAVHCYECDDYVLSDAPWLAKLREELGEIEFHRDGMMYISKSNSLQSTSTDDDADYEMVEPPTDSKLSSSPIKEGTEVVTSFPSPPPSPIPAKSSGTTGLANLGNTCYMNSTLQMLVHCSGFESYFRDFLRAQAPLRLSGEGGYTLARQTTTRLKDDLHKDQTPDELALTEATHALLRVLWSGRWNSIQPRAFVNAVWKHSIIFAVRKQQDANEFMNWYLGRVDDELKPRKATKSVMMDLFGVDQYQEVQCDGCKTISKKTEPLLGLVLSIPDDDAKETSGVQQSNNSGIQLKDCFRSLQSTGRFVGENQFECDTCKAKKDAEWRVSLQRRPQSLLISIRRTLWNKAKGLHKDSRRVRFPLEFDASDIIGIGSDKSPDGDFEGCHYTLKSVVSHSGSSPLVGHYIVYCNVKGRWHLFNDSSVTPASESSILDAEAFILLYERRTIPSINE